MIYKRQTEKEHICRSDMQAHRTYRGFDRLLSQVLTVHHNGRPDLFRANARKYNDDELKEILEDTTRPVFVADDGAGNILGYAFCVFQQHINDNILTDIKSLYIDDLCVDENCRGQHIGQQVVPVCAGLCEGVRLLQCDPQCLGMQ